VSVQSHVPSVLVPGMSSGTQWIIDCVGLRVHLSVLEKRKIRGPCRNTNPVLSTCNLVYLVRHFCSVLDTGIFEMHSLFTRERKKTWRYWRVSCWRGTARWGGHTLIKMRKRKLRATGLICAWIFSIWHGDWRNTACGLQHQIRIWVVIRIQMARITSPKALLSHKKRASILLPPQHHKKSSLSGLAPNRNLQGLSHRNKKGQRVHSYKSTKREHN